MIRGNDFGAESDKEFDVCWIFFILEPTDELIGTFECGKLFWLLLVKFGVGFECLWTRFELFRCFTESEFKLLIWTFGVGLDTEVGETKFVFKFGFVFKFRLLYVLRVESEFCFEIVDFKYDPMFLILTPTFKPENF